jgi:DNA polymerase-3 subunit delta
VTARGGERGRSRGKSDTAATGPELLREIAAGRIAPVYYLCGEPHPLMQVVAALKQAVLRGDESAFNFDAFTVPEATIGQILDAARTLPMLGPRRLVQVRDAHLLSAELLAQILPYAADPSPSTCLLLVGEKADLRLKFFGELKKSGVVVKFEPLKDRQAPEWVATEARRLDVPLEPGAAERIAEAVGTDMSQLASAIERVSLYVGPGKPVRPTDVDELLAQTRQRSIFELTNAVGRGQRREALLVLRRMLQDREPALRILAMLERHVRQLWAAKELARRGQSKNDIAASLGIHPFFVGDVLQQAQRVSEPALQRTHRALFLADRQLKSSRLDDWLILERLVMHLT